MFFNQTSEQQTNLTSLEKYSPADYESALNDLMRGYRYFSNLSIFTEKIIQNKMGVLEVGAGQAELAPGLAVFLNQGEAKLPILSTDIYELANTNAEIIKDYFTSYLPKNPSTPLNQIIHEKLNLNKQTWQKVNNQLITDGGEKWDATQSTIYEQAKNYLVNHGFGVEKLALWMRQPEFSDLSHGHIFQEIVQNLVSLVIEHQVPALIATSSKVETTEKCRESIKKSLNEQGFKTDNNQKEEPSHIDDIVELLYENPNQTTGDILLIDRNTLDFSKNIGPKLDFKDPAADLYYGMRRRWDFNAFVLLPKKQ